MGGYFGTSLLRIFYWVNRVSVKFFHPSLYNNVATLYVGTSYSFVTMFNGDLFGGLKQFRHGKTRSGTLCSISRVGFSVLRYTGPTTSFGLGQYIYNGKGRCVTICSFFFRETIRVRRVCPLYTILGGTFYDFRHVYNGLQDNKGFTLVGTGKLTTRGVSDKWGCRGVYLSDFVILSKTGPFLF